MHVQLRKINKKRMNNILKNPFFYPSLVLIILIAALHFFGSARAGTFNEPGYQFPISTSTPVPLDTGPETQARVGGLVFDAGSGIPLFKIWNGSGICLYDVDFSGNLTPNVICRAYWSQMGFKLANGVHTPGDCFNAVGGIIADSVNNLYCRFTAPPGATSIACPASGGWRLFRSVSQTQVLCY